MITTTITRVFPITPRKAIIPNNVGTIILVSIVMRLNIGLYSSWLVAVYKKEKFLVVMIDRNTNLILKLMHFGKICKITLFCNEIELFVISSEQKVPLVSLLLNVALKHEIPNTALFSSDTFMFARSKKKIY